LIRPFAGRVDESDIANEVRAIDALCKGAHVNIVEVFRHGRLKADSAFYFIDMELCDANLEEYTLGKGLPGLPSWKHAVATRATLPLIVDIMRQICDGLTFIHNHNEVHRDLNPQNGTPFCFLG
jgi:serine/threonine protein kinase